MNLRRFIGSKQFYKRVLIVAIPLMIQQVIMSSVNLVDNLMVGQLGDASIGGVGIVNRFYMIANFGTMGFVAAANIFLSQYYGAGDENHLKQSFRFSIIGTFVILTPFILIGVFAPDLIISFFTNDASYIQQAAEYFKIVIFSFIPVGFTLVIANAMRSIGETKIPLFINVLAVFMNCFFNYVLIFGHFGLPALGVAGAAIATLISRCVEAILLIIILKKYNFPFDTKVKDLLKIDKSLVEVITVKAIPLFINEILYSSGMAVLLKLYATRGADVITATSISGTTTDIFFSLFGGMAGATTILIGQSLGADKLDDAREHGYQMIAFSIMLACVFSVLMFGCSYFVPSLYDLTPATHEMAANLIRVCALMFWIYMLNTEIFFILRAGGDTKGTLLMDSCFMWTINIPVVALVAYTTDLNVYFVYCAGQCTDLVKMFIAFHIFKKEKWVKNLTIRDTIAS